MNISTTLHQGLRRRSILCVQTGQDARDFLAEILCDYECVFAENAYEALRALHARSFDAYVLDYWLQDWAGAPLCREVRKVDPNCPIVFYTAAHGETEEKRAMRAGASAYLRKPADQDLITSTLQNLLAECDRRSLRAKSEAERAVYETLKRREASAGADPTMHSLERIARGRAYKLFIQCGGSQANFDRWWPQLFGSARANEAATES